MSSVLCEVSKEIGINEDGLVMKYNKLSSEYREENDNYFWETEPPTSTVGIFRVHGLLFVGKTVIGGRIYKVAVVPKDIRTGIVELLK